MRTYKFARDVAQSEWPALPRDFKEGETVKRGSDHYGLCSDDARIGKIETVPCTLDGNFVFTVPADMLRSPEGGKIMGDYWVS